MSTKRLFQAGGKFLTLSIFYSNRPPQWQISASRRTVGLATQRNRWRRRIREALRLNKEKLPDGYRGVFRVHGTVGEPAFTGLREEIQNLIRQATEAFKQNK